MIFFCLLLGLSILNCLVKIRLMDHVVHDCLRIFSFRPQHVCALDCFGVRSVFLDRLQGQSKDLHVLFTLILLSVSLLN